MKRLVSRRLWVERSARFTRIDDVPCGFFLFVFGVESVHGGGDSDCVGATAFNEEERTPR